MRFEKGRGSVMVAIPSLILVKGGVMYWWRPLYYFWEKERFCTDDAPRVTVVFREGEVL